MNFCSIKDKFAEDVIMSIEIAASGKYAFLSNDSMHGFRDENNVWWPSVTHFIEAKKFEGTQYEDIIRKSKTARQAKRKTRERSVLMMVPSSHSDQNDSSGVYEIERRKIYGIKRSGYTMKVDWNAAHENFLRYALKQKFHQHPQLRKKLVDTYPQQITSQSQSRTAEILEEFRNNWCKKSPPQPSQNVKHDKIEDKTLDIDLEKIKGTTYNTIRDVIMKISKHISDMEGWDRIFPEMVDDAIFNVYPNQIYTNWVKRNLRSIDEMINFRKYISETRELFTKIDPFQADADSPSRKIASFVFWCSQRDGREENILRKMKRFISNESDLDKVVTIPPSKRWYRSKVPNLSKSTSFQRKVSSSRV